MGKAGQAVYAPVAGTVVKISGKPGGRPGFAGYGITVRTPQGDLFFKHLGSKKVKVGQKLKPGMLIGTLEASTAGGPHLHLGGTNRGFLDQLAKMYTRK
jgi:murein DD-endopeptidase MepM/ murein hydrolase activator NlpD